MASANPLQEDGELPDPANSPWCRWAENGQLAPKAWAIFVRPGQRAMTADLIAIAPNRQEHVGQRL